MKKKQVFVLEVIGDRKDTWQGNLRWLAGQKECSFRSVLELLCLIDSVIRDDPPDPSPRAGDLWEAEISSTLTAHKL